MAFAAVYAVGVSPLRRGLRLPLVLALLDPRATRTSSRPSAGRPIAFVTARHAVLESPTIRLPESHHSASRRR